MRSDSARLPSRARRALRGGLALLLLAHPVSGQPVRLVKNINNVGTEDAALSRLVEFGDEFYFTVDKAGGEWELRKTDGAGPTVLLGTFETPPTFPIVAGGLLFFAAGQAGQGSELWRTDGTALGTVLLRDIRPGPESSFPRPLGELGGLLIFSADDGVDGRELWKSDGTAGGTVLVKDIRSGSGGGIDVTIPPALTLGATLFFVADDGLSGPELWRTDGAAAGTTRVRDIRPGPEGSLPGEFAELGGLLIFSAEDGTSGREPWKSDGSEGGTVRVADIRPGPEGSFPFLLGRLGSVLLLRADDGASGVEPWQTDGSTVGTVLVRDIRPGSAGSLPLAVGPLGGLFLLTADDGVHGRELWRTDGTGPGTVLVKDFPGSGGTPPHSVAGGVLFFARDDGASGEELWRTDGFESGTALVEDIAPGADASRPEDLTELDGKLLFSAFSPTAGRELWIADPAGSGVTLVRDISPGANGSFPDLFGTANGLLFLRADDGTVGGELWRSDGTGAGTLLIEDLDTTNAGSSPDRLTRVGGTLFFVAWDPLHGYELWRSDGTEAGTVMVKDIRPGPDSSGLLGPTSLVAMGGTLFFAADDGVHGVELWRSDGTAAGTAMVKDIRPGAGGSSPDETVAMGGTLFFSATDGALGVELWKSDGSAAGTVMVRDIRPGAEGSGPEETIAVGGTLFFAADDGVHGAELWKSDGTAAGTVLVKDVLPGPEGILCGYPNPPFPTRPLMEIRSGIAGDKLVFSASEGSAGGFDCELWASDGTAAGTVFLGDLYPGAAASLPDLLTPLGGELFLMARSPGSRRALWKTDGTAAGTSQVHESEELGPFTPAPDELADFFGTLAFSAADGHGHEPWLSDGTPAGTRRLIDLSPGPTGSDPAWLAPFRGRLYFSADDGVSGREMWSSDGTAADTGLVADLRAAGEDSDPSPLTRVGGLAFFAANDGVFGRELWVVDTMFDTLYLAVTRTGWGSGTVSSVPAGISCGDDCEDFYPPGTPVGLEARPDPASRFGGWGGDPDCLDGVVTMVTDIACECAFDPSEPTLWHPFFAVDLRETPEVGDFDGDGLTDIATFTRNNPLALGDVYVALSDGTRFLESEKWSDWFAIDPGEKVVIGDFDGDGDDDIGTWLGTGRTLGATFEFYVALSTGAGLTDSARWLARIGGDPDDLLFAGDVDDDRDDDLILFNRVRGQVWVARSDGVSSFAAPELWHGFFAVSTWERPGVGDVDGDGRIDILTFATDSPTAFGDVYVAVSDGDRFTDLDGVPHNSTKWHDWFAIDPRELVRLADFDGDGDADALTFLPQTGGEVYVSLSERTGLGPNQLYVGGGLSPGPGVVMRLGDVDGDRKADIIRFEQTLGRVGVLLTP